MKSRRIRLVESTVQRTARMLAREHGIQVVWRGSQAKTEGKTIILPVLPDDAPDELLEAVQGYLDHETAHILFTDFAVVPNYRPTLNPEQTLCVNVCEDVRIEYAMGRLYPGSPYNLHRVHDWIYPRIAEHWKDINPFRRAISAYFDYEKYRDTEFWNTVVDADTKARVHKCIAAIGPQSAINSTEDALQAGLRMYEVLKDEVEEEKKRREEQEEKEKKEKQSGKPGQEGQSGAGQQKDAAGKPMVTTAGDIAAALMQASKQMVDKQGQARSYGYQHNQEEPGYLVYSTAGDTYLPMPDGNLASNGQRLQKLRDDSRDMTNVIQTRLVNSLRATARRRWLGGKEEGKLDSRRLHHAILGTSDYVYKQLTDKPALNTVVGLAIDHSGSMNGTKLDLAGKSAIVIGDALNVLRVPFMVYGYSTEDPAYNERPTDTSPYARWGRLWIRYYRDFAETWEKGAIRLAGAQHNCKNNTIDGESVKHGIQRLLLRPEKRKILLVLNDGMPYPNYGNLGRVQQNLHDVIASAKTVGVEVVAFGIQAPDVAQYYPNHVLINKLEDLVAEPLNTLDRMLRGGVQMK